MEPKSTNNERKIDKLTTSGLKLLSKDIIDSVKKQAMEWEKIFANQLSDKRFLSGIHKELIQVNNNKNKQKWPTASTHMFNLH
jgi:hypothetical protein